MTNEPDSEEAVYPDLKMSEETRRTIAMVRTMMVDAEQERPPAYILFQKSVLELCGGLFASDDYWSDDGWPAIKALQENVHRIFEAHTAAFNTLDWRTMAQVWGALCKE